MRNAMRRRWLRSTWETLVSSTRSKAKGGRRFGALLRLEDLEGRLVPTTPSVLSLARSMPLGPVTSARSVSYTLTFSEAVSGVDATDFQLALTGNVTATTPVVVAGSGAVYAVTVNGIAGTGTLGLNLVNNGSIQSLAGDPLVQIGGPASFQNPTYLGAGSYPEPVASGDVNRDGRLDLVTANHFGGNVSVFLGNGDGSFQSQRTFAAGNGPTDVKLADVNRDGKLDIIVANCCSNNVSVLLGNGDGTFQNQTFLAGSHPGGIAVADVNADGRPDVVVTNQGNQTVGVHLGNGDGTFLPPQTYATGGTNPYFLAVADVNGDLKPDLIVPNEYSDNLSVLLGNGDGTFRLLSPLIPTRHQPTFVAVADLDGDNKPDLAIADGYATGSDGVSVMRGNGDGTFRFQDPHVFPTGSYPFWLAPGDVDRDGKLDLAVANINNGGASVLLGNGDGTFQPQQTFLAGSDHPASVTLADLNGDGQLDLVVAEAGRNRLAVLLGAAVFAGQVYTIDHAAPIVASINRTNPAGPATSARSVTYTVTFSEAVTGVDPTDFQLALTGNVAAAELVVAGSGAVYSVTVNGITGSGTLGLNLAADGSIRNLPGDPLTGGFAGQVFTIDHVAPLVMSINRTNPVGPATSASSVTYTVTFSEPVTGVDDSDFELDLTGSVATADPVVAGGGAVYTVTVNGITGSGTLGLNLLDDGSIRNLPGDPLAGGFAGQVYTIDHVAPLVMSINRTNPVGPATSASSVTYTVTFTEAVTGVDATDFQVARTGSVAAAGPVAVAGGGAVYTVTVNGITGSGTLGLNLVDDGSITDLVGNHLPPSGGTAPFRGPTYFATTSPPFIQYYPEAVAVGDVNGDGRPDLVAANHFRRFPTFPHTVSVLLSNGDGSFQSPRTFVVGPGPNDVKLADLNGDGKLDLVVAHLSGVSVLLGNGDGTFQNQLPLSLGGTPGGVVVADVNADGKADLVVSKNRDPNVSVLLGNGNGTFQSPLDFPTGQQARSVAVADLNADNKLDIVVPNEVDNTVSVLLGNGNGTFQNQTTLATGSQPTFVAVADVNADDRPDLLIANGGGVSVLLGNGNGAFQTPTTYPTGTYPFWIAVADVNADGKLDLAVANLSGGSTSVLLGNGDGTFQPQQTFLAGSNDPSSVTLADVNGDGRPELIVAEARRNRLAVLLNAGTGNFTGQVYTIFQPVPTSTVVAAATGTYAGTTTLIATLTANGSPVSGKTVNFTLNGVSRGSAVTNSSGVATLSGVSLGNLNAGTYAGYVGVTFAGDANFSPSSGTGSLTVNPAPLTATGRTVTPTAGAPFRGVVASFANPDPFGTANSYTATIIWGDGTSSAGVLAANGSGGFDVSGATTYAAAGSYTVSVQISHVLGNTTAATASGLATVTSLGQGVQHGQSGGGGFWQNNNGQALIRSFNGGATSTALANWLAATFPNLYGIGAGANNLTGKTNAQVASFYLTLFDLQGPKLDAHVLGTALDVYATTLSLGGTAATAYGFTVTATGLGANSFNVGSSGAAFGVANNTTLNVYQILKAVNARAVNGVLYNGDRSLRVQALAVIDDLNQAGL